MTSDLLPHPVNPVQLPVSTSSYTLSPHLVGYASSNCFVDSPQTHTPTHDARPPSPPILRLWFHVSLPPQTSRNKPLKCSVGSERSGIRSPSICSVGSERSGIRSAPLSRGAGRKAGTSIVLPRKRGVPTRGRDARSDPVPLALHSDPTLHREGWDLGSDKHFDSRLSPFRLFPVPLHSSLAENVRC